MRIKINGSHDLDSIHIALQQVIAHLQDHHVAELDRINLYLTPKRADGSEKELVPVKTPAFEIIADAPKQKGGGRKPGAKRRS